jgi:sterol desaturase/sphingolipid hydroxylase (fatty acid hydroxylase superfamily)
MNTSSTLLETLKHWLPIYIVVLMGVETLILLIRFKKFYWQEAKVNLITGGITIVVQAILKIWLLTGIYPAVYRHAVFHWQPDAAMWVAGFLLYTFLQFATHVVYHKVRIFWCLHEVHHSAQHMNVTTGLRTSVFDVVSLDICYLLIPLLGIDPAVYFVLYTLNKFWGAFIHVNEKIVSRIPFLEQLLVTPAAHHVHHARNIRYLDKNYGEVIPWYDMLFGTWARPVEAPVYGTLQVQREMDFWEAQLHEFRKLWKDVKRTRHWKHKLAYFFMPPGWHPGDASGTAAALQRRLAQELSNKSLYGLSENKNVLPGAPLTQH